MKIRFIGTAVLAALISQPTFAEGMGYIGATIGSSSVDDSSGDLDTALVATGFATASTNLDDSDTGFKIFGGYLYNENWGVEVGYMDLGEFGFSGATTGPVVNYSGNIEVDTWYLAGVLNLPVADTIAINARAGFAFWDASASVTAGTGGVSNTVSGSADDDGTDAIIGVGVSFNVTDNMAIRVDYDRINTDDEVDMFSAGLQMSF